MKRIRNIIYLDEIISFNYRLYFGNYKRRIQGFIRTNIQFPNHFLIRGCKWVANFEDCSFFDWKKKNPKLFIQ
jgi:hypothetical protein